ncbi:MAG: hypothetical protein KIT69_21710, partial [Propionibacteriaceae bacterium]|nr:hypothetical protein [Propionibacteriaceae bacterium]
MFTVDFLMITAIIVVSYVFRFGEPPSADAGASQLLEPLLIGLAWFGLLSITESRNLKYFGTGLEEYRRVISASF